MATFEQLNVSYWQWRFILKKLRTFFIYWFLSSSLMLFLVQKLFFMCDLRVCIDNVFQELCDSFETVLQWFQDCNLCSYIQKWKSGDLWSAYSTTSVALLEWKLIRKNIFLQAWKLLVGSCDPRRQVISISTVRKVHSTQVLKFISLNQQCKCRIECEPCVIRPGFAYF